MSKSQYHYLDTNILLAMSILNDDSFEIADEYLKQENYTFISTTVCKEAEKKIDKLKIVSSKIIDFIKEYSLNNNINIIKIDNCRFNIEKIFLDQYKDMDFPENIEKSKFIEIVHEFFKKHTQEINEILIINDDKNLFENANTAYKINKARLHAFVKGKTCITFISSGSKINDFKKIGAHKNDAILLDESYQLYLTLNKPIHFITFDSDVLDLKNKILKNITKNVTVSSPIEFTQINT